MSPLTERCPLCNVLIWLSPSTICSHAPRKPVEQHLRRCRMATPEERAEYRKRGVWPPVKR